MANVEQALQDILNATYGEEVRQALYDSISAMNDESSQAILAAVTAQDSASASATNASSYASQASSKATEANGYAQEAKGYRDEAAAIAGGGVTSFNGRNQSVSSIKSDYSDFYLAKGTWATVVIRAQDWDSSTKTNTSIETAYPAAQYDILNVLPIPGTTTNAQLTAWNSAKCGGYYEDSNTLIARGTVPTIDINVKVCYDQR